MGRTIAGVFIELYRRFIWVDLLTAHEVYVNAHLNL